MEQQGFVIADSSEDGWSFEKQELHSDKKQLVKVDNFSSIIKCIRLFLSVIPSSGDIFLDLSEIDMGDQHLRKSMLGGWEYKTEEEIKEILVMII